jgi:hypothetical protein
MIIWLASFPRSGNTFLRILLHHLYGLQTYSGFLSGDDLSWVGAGAMTGHDALPQELRRALQEGDRARLAPFHESPEIYPIKSHLAAAETAVSELPAILMVRDVHDTLVSFAWYLVNIETMHARAETLGALLRQPRRNAGLLRARVAGWLSDLGLKDRVFRAYLRQLVRYPRWSQLNSSWMDRPSGGAPFILRFEDLVARPREMVQQALASLGLDLRPVGDRFPDFAELQSIFPAFFREGKIGAGHRCFPPRLHDQLLAVHGATMQRLGYPPRRPGAS